jgi:hypothetical protein
MLPSLARLPHDAIGVLGAPRGLLPWLPPLERSEQSSDAHDDPDFIPSESDDEEEDSLEYRSADESSDTDEQPTAEEFKKLWESWQEAERDISRLNDTNTEEDYLDGKSLEEFVLSITEKVELWDEYSWKDVIGNIQIRIQVRKDLMVEGPIVHALSRWDLMYEGLVGASLLTQATDDRVIAAALGHLPNAESGVHNSITHDAQTMIFAVVDTIIQTMLAWRDDRPQELRAEAHAAMIHHLWRTLPLQFAGQLYETRASRWRAGTPMGFLSYHEINAILAMDAIEEPRFRHGNSHIAALAANLTVILVGLVSIQSQNSNITGGYLTTSMVEQTLAMLRRSGRLPLRQRIRAKLAVMGVLRREQQAAAERTYTPGGVGATVAWTGAEALATRPLPRSFV